MLDRSIEKATNSCKQITVSNCIHGEGSVTMSNKWDYATSPHIRTTETVQTVMVDVLIALFPVALTAVILFGYQALLAMVISMVTAMVTEAICRRSWNLLGDGSAAVTGLLLALTLPPALPWWLIAAGSFSAITIGKMVFGGTGNNIFNPALVGRAVLMASWGGKLADNWFFPQPFELGADITAVSTATPLMGEAEAYGVTLEQLFLGNMAGSMGETSALALLVGAVWLFYKKQIDWRIPVGFVATVFVMGSLLGGGMYQDHLTTGLFHVVAGGVLLGALFMATDMVTSPVTPGGRLIFGIGCGFLTMVIRLYGTLPEGVFFAILIMNAIVPLIDHFTLPRKFGEVKSSA